MTPERVRLGSLPVPPRAGRRSASFRPARANPAVLLHPDLTCGCVRSPRRRHFTTAIVFRALSDFRSLFLLPARWWSAGSASIRRV